MKKIVLTLLLLSNLFAQANRILSIAPTAPTSSIGNVTLPLMNPARNVFNKNNFSFSRVNWMTNIVNDMNYNFLSVDKDNFGGSLLFFNYGQQNQADEYGIIQGQFTPISWVFGVDYGNKAPGTAFGGLVKDYYYGLEAKLIHHSLHTQKATGLVLGIGGYFPKIYKDLDLDLMIKNFGFAPKFGNHLSKLPTSFSIGMTYPYKQWMFYEQYNIYKDFYTMGNGVGYIYNNLIGKFGYFTDSQHKLNYPTFGVDFKYDKYLVSMSYIYGDRTLPLSNTIRLTINLEF